MSVHPIDAPVGVEGFDAWWKTLPSQGSESPDSMNDRDFAEFTWNAALAQQSRIEGAITQVAEGLTPRQDAIACPDCATRTEQPRPDDVARLVEPDTFFVMGVPGWPGGIEVFPNTMKYALNFIRQHGNENTTLATWCRQHQRRDYSADEVRALLTSAQQEAES